MKKIQVQLSKLGLRVFRNNVGTGWIGNAVFAESVVTISHPRPLHAGLCEGSSDLIGWSPIKITSDMVGKTLAVFTAVEVKTSKGVLSSTQKNFIDVVNQSGGIGRVVRSVEDCENVRLQWIESDP